MVVLDGIMKFLTFINDNWMMITTIIGLALAIGKKIKNYMSKSREEKIAIAKQQISEGMLKWVSLAERDWREWEKAGQIKRSQVIDLVFEKYPILSEVTNQEEIIMWLDDTIDEALKEMRKIFENNAANVNTETAT